MHLGINMPRPNTINTNPFSGNLFSKTCCESLQSSFRSGVIHIFVWTAKLGRYRGNIDDRTAFPTMAISHAFGRLLRTKHGTNRVDRKSVLYTLEAEIFQTRLLKQHACVIYQNINPPKPLVNLPKE